MSFRKMRYDASTMRDAYIKGRADFYTWKAKFENEFTGELQRNMLFIMWQRVPDEVKAIVRENNPEGYAWINEKVAEMTEEKNA